MNIDVLSYNSKLSESRLTHSTVIVVDVLRCTSTIVCAVQNGATKVIPALDAGEAAAIASSVGSRECLLGGERMCQKLPGFTLGNSPLEYSKEVVCGKTVVLSTTNGTPALHSVRSAHRVLIGAMINRTAVARRAVELERDIIIVCAGTDAGISADDFCAAGAIIDAMCSASSDLQLSDISYICRHLYHSLVGGGIRLEDTLHYSRLLAGGFESDVRFCFQTDITDVVPEYSNGIIR